MRRSSRLALAVLALGTWTLRAQQPEQLAVRNAWLARGALSGPPR